MGKMLKALGWMLGIAVAGAVGTVLYVTRFLPDIPVRTDLRVEATPARIARGEYLAQNVCVCMDCHSSRDWTVFSGPMKTGTLGAGGERFDRTMNFPGVFVATNITPHRLKDWSDGELYRAITSGVSRDGHPLFPVMPYLSYGRMADEDLHSLIAYLRSLPPIASSPPPSKADPPMNVIMRLMPQPAKPVAMPSRSDATAYGAYLAGAAGCGECHTKMVKGRPAGRPYAGGFEFALPGGILRSSNITPHPTTGIGAWSKQVFLERFKAFARGASKPVPVDAAKGTMQTIMPWTMYSGMTAEDLGAIHDYLKTLPPVENRVEIWSAAGK